MRDGAARDRRPARRAAGHEGLRHAVGARPARLRREVRAPDLAQRLPARAERRLGARAAAPHRPRGVRRRSRTLVRAAFAHRRKALPRSLEEAGGPGRRARGRVRARSRRWATRPTRAPRRSAPRSSSSSRASWSASVEARDARAREAQPLPVRRAAARRRPARDLLAVPADHARRRGRAGVSRCRARRGRVPGRRGPEPRRRRAARLSRALRLGRAAGAHHDREAHPGRRRPRRRLGRRGGGAAPGGAGLRAARRPAPSSPSSRCRSAPTCRRSSSRGPRSSPAPARGVERLSRSDRVAGVLLTGRGALSTAARLRRAPDELGLARRDVARRRRHRALLHNDLQARRSSSSPRPRSALELLRDAGAARRSCAARARPRSACSRPEPTPRALAKRWRGLTAAFSRPRRATRDVRSAS